LASLPKKWLFFVRGFQIRAQNGVLGTKTAILAEKSDDFLQGLLQLCICYLLNIQQDTIGIPAKL
jgi:hypothetical protein